MIKGDYIERKSLEIVMNNWHNFLIEAYGKYDHYTSGFDEAVKIVENFTSADVAPVVHGKWDDSFDSITPYCSVCGMSHSCMRRTPLYCPNCGAKMDGDIK